MNKDKLIDLCRDWIDSRAGAYLAKENVIVYYASLTGRKSDFQWLSLSIPEVLRIIKATLMDPDNSKQLQDVHLIAACQELGRVFEFGVKSRHPVAPSIFNYLTESEQDMGDIIMSMVATELYQRGFMAMLMIDATLLFDVTCRRLSFTVKARERNELLHKHFPAIGYEVRTDKYRPQVDGRKQSAIMMPGTKPKEVVPVPKEVIQEASTKIYGALR